MFPLCHAAASRTNYRLSRRCHTLRQQQGRAKAQSLPMDLGLYMVHPVHIRTADLVDTARHEPMLQMSNVNLDLQFATGWKALLSAESMDFLHT